MASDKEKLLALREVLVGKQYAEDELRRLKRNKPRFDWTSPDDLPEITVHRDDFKRKYKQELEEESEDHDINRNFFVISFFYLINLAVLIGGGIGVYFLARFGWNSAITSHVGVDFKLFNWVLQYSHAVGVHLLAAGIVCFLTAGPIMAAIDYDEYDHPVIYWVLKILRVLLFAGGAIALFAFFSYYFGDAAGAAEYIGRFMAIFFLIPELLQSLFYIALPTAVIVGMFAAWTLSSNVVSDNKGKRTYQKKYVKENMSNMYSDRDYKAAEALDHKMTRKERDIYKESYDKAYKLHQKEMAIFDQAIRDQEKTISDCNRIIRNATFLYEGYRNLETVNTFLYYIKRQKADTIKEAVLAYDSDMKHEMNQAQFRNLNKRLANVEDRLGRIEGELRGFRIEYLANQRTQTQLFLSEMNRMHNSYVESTDSMRSAMERQTAVLHKDNERLREENRDNMRAAFTEMTAYRVQLQNRPWW